MTPELFTGDTKKIKATFTSLVAEDAPTGPPADPDSQACTFTVYNADERSILSSAAVRESTGVFSFEWTAPVVAGTYWVEFKGLFNGKPELKRKKYSVKFKGDL